MLRCVKHIPTLHDFHSLSKTLTSGGELPVTNLDEGLFQLRLISIGDAARLLGLDPTSLRRRETVDGRYAEVYGYRIRVHRLSPEPNARRRYDADEIYRILSRLSRGR